MITYLDIYLLRVLLVLSEFFETNFLGKFLKVRKGFLDLHFF